MDTYLKGLVESLLQEVTELLKKENPTSKDIENSLLLMNDAKKYMRLIENGLI